MDKSSRPLVSALSVLIFAAIAYVNVVAAGDIVCMYRLYPAFLSLLIHAHSRLAASYFGSLRALYMALHMPLPVCDPLSYPPRYRKLTYTYSIRFRHAWTIQGHSIEELPYQAMGGVYGSWLGVVLIILVLIAQFYVVSSDAARAPS